MLKSIRQFSIRELLLVTLVVAIALGWLIDRTRLKTIVKELQFQAEIRRIEDMVRDGEKTFRERFN